MNISIIGTGYVGLEKVGANVEDVATGMGKNTLIIFDGRNCFSINEMKEKGFTYISIGRPPVYHIKSI
jgi:hypothetical protein